MRAYIVTDKNMGVSAAFTKRGEMLKRIDSHLEDLEKDPDIQLSLEKNDNNCISLNIEVAEITEEEYSDINSVL